MKMWGSPAAALATFLTITLNVAESYALTTGHGLAPAADLAVAAFLKRRQQQHQDSKCCDVEGWHDNGGVQFDCPYYAEGDRCDTVSSYLRPFWINSIDPHKHSIHSHNSTVRLSQPVRK